MTGSELILNAFCFHIRQYVVVVVSHASLHGTISNTAWGLKIPLRCAVSLEDGGREYKAFWGLKAALEPSRATSSSSGSAVYHFLSADGWTSLTCRRDTDGTFSGTLAVKRAGAFRSSD